MLATLAAAPPELAGPSRRVILAGGKRLRPALVLAAAACAEGPQGRPAAIQAAAAIELVHTGTLIHDDIMDAADTRRGQPTISAQEGSDVALMAGDYLLAQAGVLAAGIGADAAALLSATVAEMSAGQARELAALYDAGRTAAGYRLAIHGKTAALMAAACRLGGLVGGLPGPRLNALGAYGEAFGLAFQIADDLDDLESDLAAGVYNLPVVLGLHGPSAAQLSPMLGRRPARPLDTDRAIEILRQAGSIPAAAAEASHYLAEAKAALATFEPTPVVNGLAALPQLSVGQALHLL